MVYQHIWYICRNSAKANSKQAVYLSVVLFIIAILFSIKLGLFEKRKEIRGESIEKNKGHDCIWY